MNKNFNIDDLDEIMSDTPVQISSKHGPMFISPRMIFKMCSLGWSVTDISKLLCIDDNTLYRLFGDAIQSGKATIGPKIKANVLRQALAFDKPNPTILLFAAKNWAGMSDEGMKDGDAAQTGVNFTVSLPTKPTIAPAEQSPDTEQADE